MVTAKEEYEKMSLYGQHCFWCTVFNVANVTNSPESQKRVAAYVHQIMNDEYVTLRGILHDLMYLQF